MKNRFLGLSAILLLSMNVICLQAGLMDTIARNKCSLGVLAATAAACFTGYKSIDCNSRETDLLISEVGWEKVEKLQQDVDLLNHPVIQRDVTTTTTTVQGGKQPKLAETKTKEKHSINWISFL